MIKFIPCFSALLLSGSLTSRILSQGGHHPKLPVKLFVMTIFFWRTFVQAKVVETQLIISHNDGVRGRRTNLLHLNHCLDGMSSPVDELNLLAKAMRSFYIDSQTQLVLSNRGKVQRVPLDAEAGDCVDST